MIYILQNQFMHISLMIMKYIKSILDQCQMFQFHNFFLKLPQLARYVTTTSFNRYPCPGIDGMSESESYMLHVNPQEATAECGQPEPKLFS